MPELLAHHAKAVAPLPSRMCAVVKTDPRPGALLQEVPVPIPGPNEVLVKVVASTICGTDLHIYGWDEWSSARICPPLVMGHEFCGHVVAVGSGVTDFQGGEFVSAETHITCGLCRPCRQGAAHVCRDVTVLGVDTAGSFAEYVKVPAKNAWKNPKDMPIESACLQEPLGNAVHAVLAGPVAGKGVAIVGCGPIGIMAVGVALAAGATAVWAIDVNDYRLELARQMGATRILNPLQHKVVDAVLAETGGEGVEVVCEMSGHEQAIRQAFELLANGGRLVQLGIPKRPVELDLANSVVFKAATVQGIFGRRMFETWYETSALLTSRRLDVSSLVTHRFSMADFDAAMALVSSGNCGKVMLLPA